MLNITDCQRNPNQNYNEFSPPTRMAIKKKNAKTNTWEDVEKSELYYIGGNVYTTSMKISMELLLFSHSVMSDSLQTHGLQYTRLPCPSLPPRACSNPCPLSQWCHWTILSYVVPSPSCLQSFPASESFQMNQFFTSGGQSIEASASASVLPTIIQDWFPLGWTGWISLLFKKLSRVFSKPQFESISSSALSHLYGPTLTSIHDYWKNHRFD